MAARGPKAGRRGLGRSRQLLLNKFFDPSTPSMRKDCHGENWKKWKRIMKIVVHYRRASQLPEQ